MFREIYLDNSATTRPHIEVADYINHINRQVYGNPSSMHIKGIEAERKMKKAREIIAESLNVESKEIYFTSGGTESNNLAIRGYLEANPRTGKHIITTKIDHPSVLEVYKYLSERGYTVDYIEVNSEGIIDLEELKSKISTETSLISIILVNNEIGSIQPIEQIVEIKNSVNSTAVIHVDAVQAYCKINIAPKKLKIDIMSVSSHKIHGPKGVGALYINKNIRVKPLILGGGQELLIRAGTENVSGICGFGLAAEMSFRAISENFTAVAALKELFIKEMGKRLEDYKIVSSEQSSPYILNVAFKNLKAEVLLHHLEEKGIYVSTGSACSSRKNLRSHVLQAIKLDRTYISGAIRFSFSHLNTEEEVLLTIDALEEIIPRIRKQKVGKG